MQIYDVYTGYDNCTPDQLILLEGYALGLGLQTFTSFDARSGWVDYRNEQVYEPQRVFRFIVQEPPVLVDNLPWPIREFARHAKRILGQDSVFVTQTVAKLTIV